MDKKLNNLKKICFEKANYFVVIFFLDLILLAAIRQFYRFSIAVIFVVMDYYVTKKKLGLFQK